MTHSRLEQNKAGKNIFRSSYLATQSMKGLMWMFENKKIGYIWNIPDICDFCGEVSYLRIKSSKFTIDLCRNCREEIQNVLNHVS